VNPLLPELSEAVYFLDSLLVEYPFTKEEKNLLARENDVVERFFDSKKHF